MSIFSFVLAFIRDYKEILVSILSLIVSLAAFAVAHRSLKSSETAAKENKRIMAFEKRSQILEAIDKKNAKIGNLLAIYAEKLLICERHPELVPSDSGEVERIKNNIQLLQKLSAQYEYQRGFAEKIDDDGDIALNERTLADVKRLLIHLEEDIVKEERVLIGLKQRL